MSEPVYAPGVYTTFTFTCQTCAATVQVIDGQEQPHFCGESRPAQQTPEAIAAHAAERDRVTAWDRVADQLIDQMRQAILDQAATWEHIFPDGIRGDVVGVPDAAVVAARTAFAMLYKRGLSEPATRPTVVCLCGSTRFGAAFAAANLRETLAGRIVLSIGCNMRADTEIFGHLGEAELTRIKTDLDELHKRKIDLAHEILVLNVGGYVGESTRSEIAYAQAHGKRVRWLEDAERLPDSGLVFDAPDVPAGDDHA